MIEWTPALEEQEKEAETPAVRQRRKDGRPQDDEEEEEGRAAELRAIRRRRKDNSRAKTAFVVKLALFVACLIGIFVGLKVAFQHINDVRSHNEKIKGNAAPR